MPDNRIPTNQSQIEINTSIQALNTQITALNALIADLGLVSITPISQADYDNLSPTDKLNGVFDIYDAVEPDIDGNKVLYNSNSHNIKFKAPNGLSADREITLPDKVGTLVVGQVSHFNCTGVASTSHSSGWFYADYEITLNKTYGSNAVAIVTHQRGVPFIDQADISGNKLYVRIWSLSSFNASTSFAVNVLLAERDIITA